MHSSKRGCKRQTGSGPGQATVQEQNVCSELILMENNILQKEAPWLDPDCAKIDPGVGPQ